MHVRIYQINTDRGGVKEVFTPLDQLEEMQGNKEINAALYDMVFDGNVRTDSLEGVYEIFNIVHPSGYKGRSLSVSDIVEVTENGEKAFYYCDCIGFKKVRFEHEKAHFPAKTVKNRDER